MSQSVASRARYRAVGVRVAAAVFGGYALAAAVAIWTSYILPMRRADAVVTGELISFAVYAAAILWAFAARTPRWAALGLIGSALAFAVMAWLTGPSGRS